ncbi:hypothetical protein GCM10009623_36720 [Nocardioides aestuarii]|uniref:Sulfotransferase family protein n=1 Tax=Nocardioides aestuarii TaxID=252231 RepID=A0ABW4TQJ8_9ACTN
MVDVHLHVGLPKTGTTSIQAALDSHADALADAGVLYPGGRHRAHRLAAYDLLGQRVKGDDAGRVAGAFNQLVEEVAPYEGRSVVVSEEELGLARPRHVRRVVRSLAGHRVHVVVGLRDLGRTVVSAWQQDVVTGGTTSWRDYIAAVREPERSQVPSATAFWVRHDPLRVLDAWTSVVPVDRVTLVTVPPAGAPGRVLLERFGEAVDLPVPLWDREEPRRRNVSFGAAELEVIRRLNPRVLGPLNTEQYRFVVEAAIRPRTASAGSRPLRLPPEHSAWACDRAGRLVADLEARGVRVVGDLGDLVPLAPTTGSPPFDVVTEAELLEAAESVLAAVALAHGGLFRRYRRAFEEREGRLPTPAEVAGSSVRAAGFGLQKAALRRTSDSRLLAWAARRYVRRTARSRR